MSKQEILAHEAWLFKNKRASHLVQQGLEDAKRGRMVKRKEDFSKYGHPITPHP